MRSRHEKLVARILEQRQLSYWLPLIEQRNRWSDRYKMVAEPLFPGYLFVNIGAREASEVYKCRGVVRLVGFNGQPHPIPVEELISVQIALDSKLKHDPYPHLREGTMVEVAKGPLKGAQGRLVERNRRHRIVIAVNLINQAIAV